MKIIRVIDNFFLIIENFIKNPDYNNDVFINYKVISSIKVLKRLIDIGEIKNSSIDLEKFIYRKNELLNTTYTPGEAFFLSEENTIIPEKIKVYLKNSSHDSLKQYIPGYYHQKINSLVLKDLSRKCFETELSYNRLCKLSIDRVKKIGKISEFVFFEKKGVLGFDIISEKKQQYRYKWQQQIVTVLEGNNRGYLYQQLEVQKKNIKKLLELLYYSWAYTNDLDSDAVLDYYHYINDSRGRIDTPDSSNILTHMRGLFQFSDEQRIPSKYRDRYICNFDIFGRAADSSKPQYVKTYWDMHKKKFVFINQNSLNTLSSKGGVFINSISGFMCAICRTIFHYNNYCKKEEEDDVLSNIEIQNILLDMIALIVYVTGGHSILECTVMFDDDKVNNFLNFGLRSSGELFDLFDEGDLVEAFKIAKDFTRLYRNPKSMKQEYF